MHDHHSTHKESAEHHETPDHGAHEPADNRSPAVTKNRFMVLVGVAVLLMGISGYGLYRNVQPKTSTGDVVITLTEDGFTPDTLTITKGTTVTFASTNNEYYWPASDLHPSHGIYPDFDPKEPIAGDKTWSFRFDKVGTWKFHDHIAPYYTGTITVTEAE